MPDGRRRRATARCDYEELVADGDPGFEFPDVDENRAAAMCYTSGTTGQPKGVVYSHRSTVLHSLVRRPGRRARAAASATRSCRSCRCSTPTPGACPTPRALAGARLVLPGPAHDARRPRRAHRGRARHAAPPACPTIWKGVLAARPAPDLSSPARDHVRRLGRARGADPRPSTSSFGLPIVQAWGMTETEPARRRSAASPRRRRAMTEDERLRGSRAVRRAAIVSRSSDFRIDEEAGGELQVRGPWIARDYYNDDRSRETFTEDGWLRTGDVAELRRRRATSSSSTAPRTS